MKVPAKLFLIVVAGAAGLVLGFALRKRSASDIGLVAESRPALVNVSRTNASHPGLVQAGDRLSLAAKLERDLSMSAGVTHWLYWFEAIEKAQPGDFPQLARLAQGNAAATRLVTDRWIEVYPRHLFDTIVAAGKEKRTLFLRDAANRLFRDWPKRDLDAAIEALSTVENPGMFHHYRYTLAAAVMEKDPERGILLFSKWRIDDFGPWMTGIPNWVAGNPRHAAEFTLDHPSGYVSQLAAGAVGEEWAKTDPAAAVQFGVGRPGELGEILASAALKVWAGRNLNEAANWLAAADPRTRNCLGASLVEAWAKTDANAALAWCEENLSGTSLATAVGGAVKGVAEKETVAAMALVTSLNPSGARAEAAAVVARKLFPELSEDKPTAPETIAWLSALDSDSVRRVLNEVYWMWGTSDPKSMAAFLAASGERYDFSSYSVVARELARKNPMDALEWARGLPEDRGLSAGADAFAEWRSSQPDNAMKWLNQLPPGDARRQRFFESAIRAIAWDAQSARPQLAALNGADRAVARGVIAEMKIPEDHRARLLEILKGP